jgi:hypothetical protein
VGHAVDQGGDQADEGGFEVDADVGHRGELGGGVRDFRVGEPVVTLSQMALAVVFPAVTAAWAAVASLKRPGSEPANQSRAAVRRSRPVLVMG